MKTLVRVVLVAAVLAQAACINWNVLKSGAALCTNGVKDGDETDVDCGGACAANCALNQGCAFEGDCESGQCNAIQHVCTEGPCADGIKNNQETDIDCGGGGSCSKCRLHAHCQFPTDCETDHCDDQKVCELHPLEWNLAPQLLCSRVSGSAAALGKRIVVAGGRASCVGAMVNDSYNIVETHDVDPLSGPWVEAPVLKVYDRPGARTLASGQTLFVIGGIEDSGTGTFATVLGSNGTANFVSLANMMTSRAYFAATTLPDGRIFVAGGHTGDLADPTNALSSTEIYTPDPTWATPGTWVAGAPLGVYRVGAGMVQAQDSRIFVMGGQLKYKGGPLVDTVEIYTSPTSPPTAGRPMPAARSYFGSIRGADGRFYVVGGTTAAGDSADVLAYDPVFDVWTRLPDLPEVRTHLVLVLGADSRLYAIGGSGGATPKAVFVYGPSVSLTPASAAPGATITVSGASFLAATDFSVFVDSIQSPAVGSGTTSLTGYLPSGFTVTLPEGLLPGPHTMIVMDAKSQYPVQAGFQVP